MATSYRTIDTDTIQLRTIYARGPQNQFLTSSSILFVRGDGSTIWHKFPTSAFNTVQAGDGTSYTADASNTTIRVSTVGISGCLGTTVNTATSTLLLSNLPPPIGVSEGSVPTVSEAIANTFPNGTLLNPVDGNSTIKFFGVGGIVLSTVSASKSVFISISSFSASGYSTLSGEVYSLRPYINSTFSTLFSYPSFVSTVPFVASNWNWGTGRTPSTVGRDMVFSTVQFQGDTLIPYVNLVDSNTKCFIEYRPNLFFPRMTAGTEALVKEISSYLQVTTTGAGTVIVPESVVTNYITSQTTGASLSNWYNTPIKFPLDAYDSLYDSYVANSSNPTFFSIYHRVVNAFSTATTETGFPSTGVETIDILTPKGAGVFVELYNSMNSLIA